MTTTSPPQAHRVEVCLGRIAAELDDVQPVAAWATTRSQRVAAIGEIHRLEARLAALKLALVAQADVENDAADEGAVQTAALVRALTLVPGPVAVQLVKLARALTAHPVTHDALSDGTIDVVRAREVVAAVDDLPASVDIATASEPRSISSGSPGSTMRLR